MAIRSGKSYYQITKVLEEAEKKATETPVIYASPKIAKRMQKVVDELGIKIQVKKAKVKWQKA